MSSLLKMHKNAKTECPCCQAKIKDCPFCGSPGVILTHCENTVFCDNVNCCDAQIDFGHFFGIENGIPAIHHVITAWNRRVKND